MRTIFFLAGILTVTSSCALWAQSNDYMLKVIDNPQPLTFKEAALSALAQNIALKKSQEDVKIADSEKRAATSKILPSLTAKATHGSNHKIPSGGPDEQARAALQMQIPLVDVKSILDIKSKTEGFKQAKDQFEFDQQNLINDVGLLYIDALIAEASKDASLEGHILYQQQMAKFERKGRSHETRSLALDKMEYQLNNSQGHAERAEIDFNKKKGELGRKIGVQEDFLLVPVQISSPHLEKDLATLLAMAQSAPDYQVARRESSSARYSLLSEKWGFFPTLNSSLDAGYNFLYSLQPRSTDFSVRVMLNLELPLFSGGSTLASIKNKTAQQAKSDLNLKDKAGEKELLLNGLKRQNQDLQNAKASAERALTAAQRALATATRLAELQELKDAETELIDAITNHTDAKTQYVTSTYNHEAAKIKLLQAIGKAKELVD